MKFLLICWKVLLILEGIWIIFLTLNIIGWYLWKRKCDKKLAEALEKIDKEYWTGYLDCVNIHDVKIQKRKGYNFKKYLKEEI